MKQNTEIGLITSQDAGDELAQFCAAVLESLPDSNIAISARRCNEFHPYRGKKVARDGSLAPLVDTPEDASTNRQELGDVFVYDNRVCAFRQNAESGGQVAIGKGAKLICVTER